MQGTLRFWKGERGFGFIRPDDGSEDVFVHVTAFESHGAPREGMVLKFDTVAGRNGKQQARGVHIIKGVEK